MNIKLSIIIVNWNTRELLKQTLDSVYAETKTSPLEVIVVDNASSDGSQQMVKDRFPQARLIENADNLGFGKANNQGLAITGGEFIMFLNSDVIVLDRAIDKLVEYLAANGDVAMVGPRLLNVDGTFQHACRRNLPNPVNSFLYLSGLGRLLPSGGPSYKREEEDENATGPTQAISGAAMLFRRGVYDSIGGFDEDFFMYGEDLDFCKRVQDRVGPIAYVAEAKITHIYGGSSKKRKAKSLLNFYDAMWLYYRKHFKNHNPLLRVVIWCGIRLKMLLALAVNALKR